MRVAFTCGSCTCLTVGSRILRYTVSRFRFTNQKLMLDVSIVVVILNHSDLREINTILADQFRIQKGVRAPANRIRAMNSSARTSATEKQTCPYYVLGIENTDQQGRQTAAETQGNAIHALLLQDKSKGKAQGQQRMKDQQMVRRAQKQIRTGQHRTCAKCQR